MDPLVNRAWIFGRPLHHLADEPTLADGPASQFSMDLSQTINTIWKTNLLQTMDHPVNQTWISGRPLHKIIFITD